MSALWEDLTIGERNVWVATAMMGWPVIDGDTPYAAIYRCGGFVINGVAKRFTGMGHNWRVFQPAVDAGDDFLVLRRLRDRAEAAERGLGGFVECLKTVRWARCPVSVPYSLELFAEPGDYSHAAYLLAQGEIDDLAEITRRAF
jgi:hypothetical protein